MVAIQNGKINCENFPQSVLESSQRHWCSHSKRDRITCDICNYIPEMGTESLHCLEK
jgi:hypothetical protein